MLQVRHVILGCAFLHLVAQATVLSGIIEVIATRDQAELNWIRHLSEYMAPIGISLFAINYFVIRNSRLTLLALPLREKAIAALVIIAAWATITPAQRLLITTLSQNATTEQRRQALVVMSGLAAVTLGQPDPLGLHISLGADEEAEDRVALLLLPTLLIAGNAVDSIASESGKSLARALFSFRQLMRPGYEKEMAPICAKAEEIFSNYKQASDQTRHHWFNEQIAQEIFRNKRSKILGSDSTVELGLSREQLLNHPEVQAKARYILFSIVATSSLPATVTQFVSKEQMLNWLNIVLSRKTIDPCMKWPDFEREYLGPLAWRVAKEVGNLASGGDAIAILGASGQLAEVGRRLVEFAIVPPLVTFTILLSSIFTVATIVNLGCYGYFGLTRWRSLCVGLTVFALIAALPFLFSNRIAGSARFVELRGEVMRADALRGALWLSAEWVLRGAPIIYQMSRFPLPPLSQNSREMADKALPDIGEDAGMHKGHSSVDSRAP